MQPLRRAVIDVGTNSIKLLVAEVAGHSVRPMIEESKQTRLGQSFYQTHRLQAGPIASTAAAVADFVAKARRQEASVIRIIATSAAREAVNAAELTAAIENACGLPVEVISGDQEADWAFQGVTTDAALAREPLLLIEVGGGSTEFILGHGEQRDVRQSFALGTVRLLEQIPHSDPPRPEELTTCRESIRMFLRNEVQPQLEPAMRRERKYSSRGSLPVVGTGGTASILGCIEARLKTFDRERLEATRLSLKRLHWHVEHLWELPLAERKEVVGLPRNRADVILTGAAIYEGILDQLGFPELRISTRGLRFGAVLNDQSKGTATR